MKQWIFTNLLLCSMSSIHVSAQFSEPTWEVMNPATTGIPGEEVRFAKQAPDGKFWVGARWPFWSEGGLGVFDRSANTWTVHSNVPKSDTTPFPSAFPNDLEFAADGTAWCASEAGLSHLVNGVWQTYSSSNSPMPWNDVQALDIDSQGRIWINLRKSPQFILGRVMMFDGATWKSWGVGAPGGIPWTPPWENFSGIVVDANDHVWIGNYEQPGFAEYDGVKWTIRAAAGIPPLNSPFVDSLGHVWGYHSYSGNDAYRFNGSSWTKFNTQNTPFTQTGFTSFAMDAQNRVLIGNWAGEVCRQVAPGSDTFEKIVDIGLPAYSMMPQSNGDLWLTMFGGTFGPGIFYHLDAAGSIVERFNTYNTGCPEHAIDRFDVDRNGHVWMATGLGGLSRYDGTRWRNWGAFNLGSEPYPFAGNTPMGGLFIDSQGRGWMGGNGIAQWDPIAGSFSNFWNWQNNPGMGVTNFTHFVEDVNGDIFAADEAAFIYKFNGTLWVQNGPQPTVFTSDYAGLYTNSQGHVYAAGPNQVFKWNGIAWASLPIDPNFFIPLGGVTAFAIAPDDTLWIGCAEAVVHYDGTNLDVFSETNSPMPAQWVQGIDVREDGLVAISASTSGPVTPFPHGVCLIQGDPKNTANWHLYAYPQHLAHFQIGKVAFDALGDLWIATTLAGCTIAHFDNAPPACAPDCDESGSLTIDDFICFLTLFALGDPGADCDASSALSIDDFICFQTHFALGC